MERKEIGQLIARLRKEKRLTQRGLSEMLHVSDRTISKWERGAGVPDIQLLQTVSTLFQVPMEQLLKGELGDRDQDSGNMKHMKFYICPTCGNIMWSIQEAEMSCCGRRLEEMVPQKEALAHAFEEMDGEMLLSLDHEMSKEHYLSFVAIVKQERMNFIKLYPEQASEIRIPLLRGNEQVYVYCSNHGLFQWQYKKRKS